MHMHGVGGRMVRKLVYYNLGKEAKCKPDILILEIGANDLNEMQPKVVGSKIQDLVKLLHKQYGVKVVAVSASINRRNQGIDFNQKVDVLNQYLHVVLEPLAFAFFFSHRGLQNPFCVIPTLQAYFFP